MAELMLGVVASKRAIGSMSPFLLGEMRRVLLSSTAREIYWNASCLLWLSLSTVGRWCYPWLKLRDHFDILAGTPPKKKYFLLVCG
jgi:hypothetical protein